MLDWQLAGGGYLDVGRSTSGGAGRPSKVYRSASAGINVDLPVRHHDVLITLGAIAVSYWLVGVLGFLQIEEFKISLPVVAAFLTIIGYSLNDTIVVFDRIREVRGKSPELTDDMINASINQTLGRTLLTSLTTLIVVAILYALGGQSIHGFSFALLVGVVVGTYSSIFVASPALLWMMKRMNAH